MKTIFDTYNIDEIETRIEEITILLNKGHSDNDIIKKLDIDMIEELLSIAKARIKSEKDSIKSIGLVNYFNLNDFRFSTPEIIANYRAIRLKTNKIVDLCSGIGIQTNAFSVYSKETYGFEIDERKVKYSNQNFSKKNLKFFNYDVLSKRCIEEVKKIKPDIIFCDPERLIQEEERSLSSIKPNVQELIKDYSKITKNICIELPPQIDYDKLSVLGNFEAEYLTINNKLNRLDLYFGELKKSKISVVDAETFERLEKDPDDLPNLEKYNAPLKYVFEVTNAITKAGLINELAFSIDAGFYNLHEQKTFLTSNEIPEKYRSFIKCFEVIGITKNFEACIKVLKSNFIGKVVLRGNVDPKFYWKERNKIENFLDGKTIADLFILNDHNDKRIYLISKEVEI